MIAVVVNGLALMGVSAAVKDIVTASCCSRRCRLTRWSAGGAPPEPYSSTLLGSGGGAGRIGGH